MVLYGLVWYKTRSNVNYQKFNTGYKTNHQFKNVLIILDIFLKSIIIQEIFQSKLIFEVVVPILIHLLTGNSLNLK